LDAESLPTSVRCFVASEADEASRNQRDALLALASWKSDAAFGGRTSWRWRDTVIVTIPEHHLYRDHLDRALEGAFGEPVDLVVYLSKHVSESRRPSLTVHPIGNPRGAEFGGQPETLVPSAPRWMTAALRGLRKEAKGLPYNVTFEATHHGPYLTKPTFYIEQGSTETEWADLAASRAIARVLLALEQVDAPIAIGLGGGHYVPRHTDRSTATSCLRSPSRRVRTRGRIGSRDRPGRRADKGGHDGVRASQEPCETGRPGV